MTAIKPSERLAELGLELPGVAAPLAAYIPAIKVGNQIWTSGQLPSVDGKLLAVGRFGAEISTDLAEPLARAAIFNALAAAADLTGGLDAIGRIIKLVVYVASTPEFTDHPQVANGASQICEMLFGEAGRHVRSAVGVAALPIGAPLELELVVEIAG